MRRAVFGLGTAQVVGTAALLALGLHLFGTAWPAAAILGAGLALSSTAIVLPMLGERSLLGDAVGARQLRGAAVPGPRLHSPGRRRAALRRRRGRRATVPWREVGMAVGAVAVILVGGRFLIPPAFRAIGGARTPEVFTALALLIVAGCGLDRDPRPGSRCRSAPSSPAC